MTDPGAHHLISDSRSVVRALRPDLECPDVPFSNVDPNEFDEGKALDINDLGRMGRLNEIEIMAQAIPITAAAKAEETSRIAFPKLDAQAIFAPLPALHHQCAELDLCSGAPNMVAGYGYSGKTVGLQQAAIDITQGSPIWGKFACKQGRVFHLDYEQGARLTRERYQRLATASLLGPSDLQDRLTLSSMPEVYLDSKYAEEHLLSELDGYNVAIIDSLKAAAPTLDENSSEIRRVLDMLGRVSERLSCCMLVIHHARKPQKDAAGGAKMAIRGSSGIFDACASVLVFEAAKGMPTNVSHEKARNSGKLAKDFALSIHDVEGNGLAVTATDAKGATVGGGAALDELKEQVRKFFRENGDQTSKRAVRERLGCNQNILFAAFAELEQAGEIVNMGTHPKRPLLKLIEVKS